MELEAGDARKRLWKRQEFGMKETRWVFAFYLGGFVVYGHFLALANFYRGSTIKRGAEALGAKWILPGKTKMTGSNEDKNMGPYEEETLMNEYRFSKVENYYWVLVAFSRTLLLVRGWSRVSARFERPNSESNHLWRVNGLNSALR